MLKNTLISSAVAGALLSLTAPAFAATAPLTVRGVVSGTWFTPPVLANSPDASTASSTAASLFQSAKVCIDANDNGACRAVPVMRGGVPRCADQGAGEIGAVEADVDIGDVLDDVAVQYPRQRTGDGGAIAEGIGEVEVVGVRGGERRQQDGCGAEFFHIGYLV